MMTKNSCRGCRNDFYNGNNNLGVKECWSFKTAHLIPLLRISINEPPPYNKKPTLLPSCRHEAGYVLVRPESLTKEGYWK